MDFDEEEAPPPYSAFDPMQSQDTSHGTSGEHGHDESPGLNVNPSQLETDLSALHIQTPPPSTLSADTPAGTTMSPTESRVLSESSATAPSTYQASAGSYFVERPQPTSVVGDAKLETLIHHMTIYTRSQSKDFPRRPRCWNTRGNEISQHDWDTFLNFLFPTHLGLAASSSRLHPQVRAEIGRDRKDRAQETDEQRSARVSNVIDEWNEQFFGPRGVHVTWTYVGDLEEGPASSLCPNCYPQATDAARIRDRLADAPIPVSTDSPVRRHTIQRRPVPQYAQTTPLPPQNIHASPTISPTTAPGQSQSAFSMLYGGRDRTSVSWKSNPMSWATQMSSIAQQYAAKISNQAQEYGRSIEESALARSRQMELYGRKMEENALARAKQFETMALTQGRKFENAGDRFSHWSRRGMNYNPVNSQHQPPSTDEPQPTTNQTQNRLRRLSTSSDRSISSVSSISTVSSVSDLEPEDLASVRQQLSALNEYHHHELYAAAVSLRSQLKRLKKARYHARRHSRGGGSWGRWESPAEATDREQRRVAMKRETRLLRQEFTEVQRRAKREVRELKRAKKDSRRKQRLEHHCGRVSSPRSQQLDRPLPPDRTMSGMDSNLFKECLVPGPSSLPGPSSDRAASAPAYQHDNSRDSISTPPLPLPSPSPSPQVPSMDPHEAAKAWTEAQRTKVKEIQRANKERLKETKKAHKEREKQERKAIKRLAKQKHGGLTRTMGTGANFTSSSSLILPETGTIRSNSTGRSVERLEDDVNTHASLVENNEIGGGRAQRGLHQASGVTEFVGEPEILELDGRPIEPPSK